MKITEKQLIETLKELHDYYWNLGKKFYASDSQSATHAYKAGKADGALEAVDAILLQVIGGKEMFEVLAKSWSEGADDENN